MLMTTEFASVNHRRPARGQVRPTTGGPGVGFRESGSHVEQSFPTHQERSAQLAAASAMRRLADHETGDALGQDPAKSRQFPNCQSPV